MYNVAVNISKANSDQRNAGGEERQKKQTGKRPESTA